MADKSELQKLILKLFKKDVLPNGKRPSFINISNYIVSLDKFTYIDQSTGKKKKYLYNGIYKTISSLVKQGKIGTGITRRSEPEPLILTDDSFDMPDGEVDYVAPYRFEDENFKTLIINDLHLYFHSTPAIKMALNEGRAAGVDKVIINGDLLDLGGVGRWTRRPDRVIIRDEIEFGKQFFYQLRKMFPHQEIIYKEGNHDERLEKFIWTKCPELYGLQMLSLSELLELNKYEVKKVASMQLMKMGELWVAHGHEFMGGAGGENVATKMLNKVKRNIIFGHFHFPQETVHSNLIDDTPHGSWSVGCLCQLKPTYHPHNNWGHGFALVEHHKGGTFSVDNKKIINGKVL